MLRLCSFLKQNYRKVIDCILISYLFFKATLVVTLLAVAHGQGERRRVRVRGRARPAAGRAINRPAPQQPPVNELSCPEPEGLQVYPDPTSCNKFYKVLCHL